VNRNQPTPEGRQLGKQIARLTKVAIEDCKAAGIALPEQCASCAFREGTFPNGCPETLLDAIDCMNTGTKFMCHHHKKGEPMHECAGWLASQKSLKLQNAMAERPLPQPSYVPWRELKKMEGRHE
jgi:hypothetical protein